MKSAKYLSLGLTSFSVVMLLAHVGTAYPLLRLGAIFTLLAAAVFASLYLGIGGLFIATRSRGGYLRQGDFGLAMTPAIAVIVGMIVAIAFGVYSGLEFGQ